MRKFLTGMAVLLLAISFSTILTILVSLVAPALYIAPMGLNTPKIQ